MKSLFATVAAGMFAGAALATPSTDVDVQSQSFAFPLSPGGATLQFNQFDPFEGVAPGFERILQKVVITVDATIGANVTAENDSEIGSEFFAVNLTGFVTVNFGGLSTAVLLSQTEVAPGGIGPSDGVPGSGPDFYDFGFVSDTDSDMDMTDVGLGAYIGNGTIGAIIAGNGGFSVSGVTDSVLTVSDFGASGVITIEYFFKIIPAPGAAGMLAMVGLFGARRRRA